MNSWALISAYRVLHEKRNGVDIERLKSDQKKDIHIRALQHYETKIRVLQAEN